MSYFDMTIEQAALTPPRKINTFVLRNWKKESFSYPVVKMCEDAKAVLLTGSKYICPSIKPNDIDIMFWVEDIKTFREKHAPNAEVCGEEYPDDDRVVLRENEYNFIITEDKSSFDKWAVATHIATALNLTEKVDRSFLFDMIIEDYIVVPAPSTEIF